MLATVVAWGRYAGALNAEYGVLEGLAKESTNVWTPSEAAARSMFGMSRIHDVRCNLGKKIREKTAAFNESSPLSHFGTPSDPGAKQQQPAIHHMRSYYKVSRASVLSGTETLMRFEVRQVLNSLYRSIPTNRGMLRPGKTCHTEIWPWPFCPHPHAQFEIQGMKPQELLKVLQRPSYWRAIKGVAYNHESSPYPKASGEPNLSKLNADSRWRAVRRGSFSSRCPSGGLRQSRAL